MLVTGGRRLSWGTFLGTTCRPHAHSSAFGQIIARFEPRGGSRRGFSSTTMAVWSVASSGDHVALVAHPAPLRGPLKREVRAWPQS